MILHALCSDLARTSPSRPGADRAPLPRVCPSVYGQPSTDVSIDVPKTCDSTRHRHERERERETAIKATSVASASQKHLQFSAQLVPNYSAVL